MLESILIGSAVIVVTTTIHAAAMLELLRWLRRMHVGHWGLRSNVTRAAVISIVVLVMFVATVAEAAVWATVFLAAGAIDGAEPAMYFSMVTYTTLGYGDVVLEPGWRLLATFEAANGIIMFGWSTALIFAGVHAVYFSSATPANGRPGSPDNT